MATSVVDLSGLDTTGYQSTDIGLQDYSQLDNSGLAAPSLDSPYGADPYGGMGASPYPTVPYGTDPSLSTQPVDASGGLNAVNPTLLPYQSPGTGIDPSLLTGLATPGSPNSPGAISPDSGTGLGTLDGNLPLTTQNSSSRTPLTSPTATSVPMGSSLWAAIFGTATAVTNAGAKAGTVNTPAKASLPGQVKAAPPAVGTNPISGTTTVLIVGVAASIIGMILWSFSGAK